MVSLIYSNADEVGMKKDSFIWNPTINICMIDVFAIKNKGIFN